MREPSDRELDFVYGHINQLHLQGQFQVTNEILKSLDIKKVPPTLLISYLTIARHGRSKISEYNNFFNRVKSYFEEIGWTDPGLLSGLE